MAVTFVIGLSGLNTSIEEVYTQEEWAMDNDLPPNMQWEHITVATEEDATKWRRAKNRWLSAAWTANQTRDERIENAQIMREAEAEMASLEIKVA